MHADEKKYQYLSVITVNGNNYRLYYLDTCALSELVKDRAGFGSNLLNLVLSDGLIAISPHSLWELKSSPAVYKDVIEVITSLPTVLLKSEDAIINDEYQSLENSIVNIDPIVNHLMKALHAKHGLDILALIDKHITEKKKDVFKQDRDETFKIIASKPSNIYSREELKLKANIEYSVQLVAYEIATAFLLTEINHYSNLKKEFPIANFLSLMSISYIIHYKYQQVERKGTESDIQDILMSALYPYVDMVITERHQCAIVKQIQKRHNFFNNLKIISMNQVRLEKYDE